MTVFGTTSDLEKRKGLVLFHLVTIAAVGRSVSIPWLRPAPPSLCQLAHFDKPVSANLQCLENGHRADCSESTQHMIILPAQNRVSPWCVFIAGEQ